MKMVILSKLHLELKQNICCWNLILSHCQGRVKVSEVYRNFLMAVGELFQNIYDFNMSVTK